MNILAIDLGAWFTSVSGILITCGVVLLIIALVLFIVGSKKAKKNGLLVKWLRRHPLKVESRVQFSYRLPYVY